jgi:branched-chain amino acid transport system permease protein
LQQTINGLTLGTIYALMALGYSMVYGVLYFINFAHGDVAMVGAYLCVVVLMGKMGLPSAPAILLSLVLTAFIGIMIDRIAYVPLRRAPRLAMIISSLGVSMILSTGAQVVWGFSQQPVHAIIPNKVFRFGGAIVNMHQLVILLVSLTLMVGLQLLVHRTKIGVALRAVSFSRETAGVMGIDTDKVTSFAFGLGSLLGAVAAIMVGIYYGTIYPTMGATIGIKAFTAAVVGGIGNIPGAMLGGLLLGVLEGLGGAYISSGYRDAIAFSALVIILLFRPFGLLGSAGREVDRA